MGGCLLLSIFIGLTACSSSTPSNYYTLATTISPLASTNVRVIEVLPVGLPDRLNRASLVLQEISGKSNVLDNERWTSMLAFELRDGLSAGLQQKLGAVDRYNSGMTGGKVSYRVAVDFSRFDIVEQPSTNAVMGAIARDIEVAVAWTIKLDDPNQPLTQTNTQNHQLSCRMAFTNVVGTDGNKIQNIVSASRQSLNQVIDAVAASVLATEAKTTVKIQGVVCA
nr:ABC-type transport auxiliary lipoprotein family protein [Acinetobacter silvestris]